MRVTLKQSTDQIFLLFNCYASLFYMVTLQKTDNDTISLFAADNYIHQDAQINDDSIIRMSCNFNLPYTSFVCFILGLPCAIFSLMSLLDFQVAVDANISRVPQMRTYEFEPGKFFLNPCSFLPVPHYPSLD